MRIKRPNISATEEALSSSECADLGLKFALKWMKQLNKEAEEEEAQQAEDDGSEVDSSVEDAGYVSNKEFKALEQRLISLEKAVRKLQRI